MARRPIPVRVPHEALKERITIEDYNASGSLGPTFGTPRTNVRASVQPTTKVVTDSRGVVTTIVSVIIIRPEAGPVPAESRVTDSLGRVFRVIQGDPFPDARRPSQWELTVAKWAGS